MRQAASHGSQRRDADGGGRVCDELSRRESEDQRRDVDHDRRWPDRPGDRSAGRAADADVAILQAEGKGFTALPLSTNAPAGMPVRVISHPDHNFYTLSEGVVSRQFVNSRRRGMEPVTMLAITADFAKGSSGGPVFDDTGAVIGIVTSTVSTYYDTNNGRRDNLQMVFKHCIPSGYLLELVRPEAKP